MTSGIRISTFILSAILISSCATDKIRYTQLECRTQKARVHLEKNIPIRSIKSNNRQYARYMNQTAWNKNHNGRSVNNILKSDKHSETVVYGSGETKDGRILINYNIKEVISLQQIPMSSEINLYSPYLKRTPNKLQLISEKEDVINNLSPEGFDVSTYSNTLLNNKKVDDSGLAEFNDKVLLSSRNPLNPDQPQERPSQRNGNFILMIFLLTGLVPFAAIIKWPGFARNISFWAAVNPWKTRLMFTGIHIGLGTAGVLLGRNLADNGMQFSHLSGNIFLAAFFTSALLYPVRYSSIKLFSHSYFRQKAFDLALALSGFMLMVSVGNTNTELTAPLSRMINLKGPELQKVNILNNDGPAQKQLVYYQDKQQLQAEQSIPQKKEINRGARILLTVLAVLTGLVLAFLLAAAACGLSCNGLEGLAYLVGIGGGLLLIGLTIFVIKSIWHPKHKKGINPVEATVLIPKESTLQI